MLMTENDAVLLLHGGGHAATLGVSADMLSAQSLTIVVVKKKLALSVGSNQ
jgi:hypothetical protein